jgi:uncharacterized membrane protein YfcA
MEWWLGYLAIGAAVGFFSGLLGIGGGAIMVPMLVMLFDAQDLPREHILHVAVGTAMATVLFNSIASARAHAALGSIRWDLAGRITPGILVGGLLGSGVASVIPRGLFAVLFTGVVYIAATNILFGRQPSASRQVPGTVGMFLVGFVISAVSALGALGGAFITIPFLMYCNVPMLQAIGTAAAVGFPIGLAGTIGFVLTGWRETGIPGPNLGYVYLPALAGILIASVLTAPLGARLAHSLPTKRLKQIFAVVLYLFATRMLISIW